MIGTWVDQDENDRIEYECQWSKNRNFITRAFTLSVGDRIDMAGMQIIVLGSFHQADPLVGLRFRRRVRRGHLEQEGHRW